MFSLDGVSFSFHLVICFIVGYGSPDVVDQRVNKILTLPHCFPAIWTGGAQISGNKNSQNNQGNVTFVCVCFNHIRSFHSHWNHVRRVSSVNSKEFPHYSETNKPMKSPSVSCIIVKSQWMHCFVDVRPLQNQQSWQITKPFWCNPTSPRRINTINILTPHNRFLCAVLKSKSERNSSFSSSAGTSQGLRTWLGELDNIGPARAEWFQFSRAERRESSMNNSVVHSFDPAAIVARGAVRLISPAW